MPSDLEDQPEVPFRCDEADVWSDAFWACLGAWEEEIIRPFQGKLIGSETEEAIDAV